MFVHLVLLIVNQNDISFTIVNTIILTHRNLGFQVLILNHLYQISLVAAKL